MSDQLTQAFEDHLRHQDVRMRTAVYYSVSNILVYPPHSMGVGSVGSTLCFISSEYPRNDHIPIDLARFWWNCRIDFTILFENPSPKSGLEICVNHADRDKHLGSKIGADPRQKMARGDRGKQTRRIHFWCIKKSKIQKCSE